MCRIAAGRSYPVPIVSFHASPVHCAVRPFDPPFILLSPRSLSRTPSRGGYTSLGICYPTNAVDADHLVILKAVHCAAIGKSSEHVASLFSALLHVSLAICEIAKSPGSRFPRAVYKSYKEKGGYSTEVFIKTKPSTSSRYHTGRVGILTNSPKHLPKNNDVWTRQAVLAARAGRLGGSPIKVFIKVVHQGSNAPARAPACISDYRSPV